MKKRVCFALIFFLCVNCAFAQTPPEKERRQPTPLIVGYLAESRLRSSRYSIKAMEQGGAAKRLTHIIYAFTKIIDGGPLLLNEQVAYRQTYSASESIDGKADNSAENKALRGAFNQLRKLKARYPRLKVLMSIGGASAIDAKEFSIVSRNQESRQIFVAACVDLLITGNLPQGVSAAGLFDGIDVV
jgi:chitinase